MTLAGERSPGCCQGAQPLALSSPCLSHPPRLLKGQSPEGWTGHTSTTTALVKALPAPRPPAQRRDGLLAAVLSQEKGQLVALSKPPYCAQTAAALCLAVCRRGRQEWVPFSCFPLALPQASVSPSVMCKGHFSGSLKVVV